MSAAYTRYMKRPPECVNHILIFYRHKAM